MKQHQVKAEGLTVVYEFVTVETCLTCDSAHSWDWSDGLGCCRLYEDGPCHIDQAACVDYNL